VAFDAKCAPGTVVISTNERRLYYVLGNGQAVRYGVGVGRPGFEWAWHAVYFKQARVARLDAASSAMFRRRPRFAPPHGRRGR